MLKNINKLNKILEEYNVDGIYLTDKYNLKYFTGFTGTTGVALATKKGNFFFSDFRYKVQGTMQVEPMGFKFVEVGRDSFVEIGDYIKKLELKKIAFEDKNITFENYEKIKDIFKVELVATGNRLIEDRMIKTEKEIETIKKAIEISDKAFEEVLKIIKEGITEKEIAGYMEYIQRKLGAEDRSFDTIVASGYRSALPHGVASEKKIQKDEFITMDFGAYYNGYVSDMTRTIYYGNNISDRHKKIYDTVLEAQILGTKMVKAGIMSNDVDTIVRNYFKEKELDKYFGHGLGHGIGLEIHELPYLSKKSEIELKENMVVTVEPGLYFDDWGGVRIEDDVVVTKNGCEILNKSSKELIIIK